MRIVAGAETGAGIIAERREPGEIRLLRQIADGHAGLHEALAGIRLDQPCRDLQQRGLARPVAADQAQPRRPLRRQFRAVEQRRGAVCDVNVFEEKDEGPCARRHSINGAP